MARNVAKAGAAKGGSCKGVFQARVKDAIRQFRNAGDRRGQERGKSRCSEGWKLQGGFQALI